MLPRRGPELNRCTGLCRPLPNHSATPPMGPARSPGPDISLREGPDPAGVTHERRAVPRTSGHPTPASESQARHHPVGGPHMRILRLQALMLLVLFAVACGAPGEEGN